MKAVLYLALAGSSMTALATSAHAQAEGAAISPADTTGVNNNDIVVTARRKDELVQEVPATINVVSADQMEKLNFRTFTDVQQLVPGLSLEG
ncbi:MAG TPA: TonB-dependent receptor, partial [Sphingobium sp.]